MNQGKQKVRRRSSRVNISVSALTDKKLKQFATACNKKPATIAQMLIDYCLDNPQLLKDWQERYNTDSAYWVRPITGLTDYNEILYLVGANKT